MTSERSRQRIVFFGTPDFAVPTLEQLLRHFTVVGCVTQPDSANGRTRALVSPPVKQRAVSAGFPALQPRRLKQRTEEGRLFLEAFMAMKPDLAVLIAYGNIIPKEVLSVPRFGFVNLHLSLLPELRGPSPAQGAILEGRTETGVTLMKMDEGMDTGDVIAQRAIPIHSNDTAASLYERLGTCAAEMIPTDICAYLNGTLIPTTQEHARATVTRLIKKEHGLIDWEKTPTEIERHIRAYTPWPGAYTISNGMRIKILAAHCASPNHLIIDRVQPEGKKPMSYADFLRGHPHVHIGA